MKSFGHKTDRNPPIQLSLFDTPSFNTCKDQKSAMNASAKQCGMSREEIVDKMNDLASRYGVGLASNGGLTLDTFEKWLNPSELNRQMPMKALPIFCAVINDNSALDVLARPLGVRVIDDADQRLLKWAKEYFRVRDARKVMRQLENDL